MQELQNPEEYSHVWPAFGFACHSVVRKNEGLRTFCHPQAFAFQMARPTGLEPGTF